MPFLIVPVGESQQGEVWNPRGESLEDYSFTFIDLIHVWGSFNKIHSFLSAL